MGQPEPLNDKDQELHDKLLRLCLPIMDQIMGDVRFRKLTRDRLQMYIMRAVSLAHLGAFREGIEVAAGDPDLAVALVLKHMGK